MSNSILKKDNKKWSKYLPTIRFNNLAEMAFHTIKKYKKKTAIRWFDENTEVQELTYGEVGNKITEVFHGLKVLGYKQGDHVAICSVSCPWWS